MKALPLRVLFLLRRAGPYHHARFVALAKRVTLVTGETRPTSKEYPWEFTSEGNFERVLFPTGKSVESGLHGKELKSFMKSLLETHSPSVVITTGWADQEYHAAVLECKRRKIPCVVISDSRYEDEPRSFIKELLKRVILKSYSAALVAGTMSTGYLLRLGFSSDKIFQPWDVVDNQYFDKSLRQAQFEERYFLCVSRFIPKKNLDGLVKAYGLYRQAGGTRTLVIAGSGEGESAIRELVKSLDIVQYVLFPGFVQYPELPALLGRALCLILPSLSDQWGLVVNEAMASSLPALVSNQSGCAIDLISPGENGHIFDAFDITELASRMHWIGETSETDWIKMGQAAMATIQKWDTASFAMAAEKASRYAVEHPSFGNFAVIHHLLSR